MSACVYLILIGISCLYPFGMTSTQSRILSRSSGVESMTGRGIRDTMSRVDGLIFACGGKLNMALLTLSSKFFKRTDSIAAPDKLVR